MFISGHMYTIYIEKKRKKELHCFEILRGAELVHHIDVGKGTKYTSASTKKNHLYSNKASISDECYCFIDVTIAKQIQ